MEGEKKDRKISSVCPTAQLFEASALGDPALLAMMLGDNNGISLAVTDLLCGILLPFNTLRSGWWGNFGRFGGEMCSAVTSLVVILMSASVYNFVLVNLDRLLVFKSPFQQQADSSRKNIKIGKCF